MSRVSTSLHYKKSALKAFEHYKSIFGGEFIGPVIRFGDLPEQPGMTMSDEDKQLVMKVSLKLLDSHVINGNDAPDFLGTLVAGNNMDLCLDPETREEADRIYKGLAEGGKAEFPMTDMGDSYFGTVVDAYGIQWMINCSAK